MRFSKVIGAAALTFLSLSCDQQPTVTSPGITAVAGPSNIMDPNVLITSSIDMGNKGGCVIAADGTLACWGNNGWGNVPESRTASASSFRQISEGESFVTCALRWDGKAECFGQNTFGAAPGLVEGVDGPFEQVSVGAIYACGLILGGDSVECWGSNSVGQAPASKPAPGDGVTYTSVEASYGNVTCAVRSDGKIDCWGSVPGGEVTLMAPNKVLKSVVSGWDFTCGLRGDGRAKCWGDNTYGQAPVLKVPAVDKYKHITAAGHHACGLRTDGVAECWGDNSNGQAPATRTAAVGSFLRISAGTDNTCGVRTDLLVECWGSDDNFQSSPPFAKFYRFNGLNGLWKTANYPALNVIQLAPIHTRTLKMQFTLGGDEGLDVIADGYPQYSGIACDSPAEYDNGGAVEGELTYDPDKKRYSFDWVVYPWTVACVQFIMKLDDGTFHRANFDMLGVPDQFYISGGNNQAAPAGATLDPITLKLWDRFANGIKDKTVNFEVIEGGGSLAASSAVSAIDGTVNVPAWTLGTSAVPQKIRATMGSITKDITASVLTDFNIVVRFFGPAMTSEQEALFTNAANRLRGAIAGDIPNFNANLDINSCLGTTGLPNLVETIDDVVIYASIASIDGPGNVLAQAGPCFIRGSSKLPILGVMQFDVDDLEDLAGDGSLQEVIQHEMLHVVGIGTIWGPSLKNLISGSGTSDPRYTGAKARDGCEAVSGTVTCATDVPLEDTGGPGTAEGHWRETNFDNELMTGYADAGGMPLSLVTLGGLEDLGYAVNYYAFDPYTIPGGLLRRNRPATFQRGWDKLLTQNIVILP